MVFYIEQEESDKTSGPVLAMRELKTGMYRVEFGSFLSHLQAFFVCVTALTCASEEETVSKTTAKNSSPSLPLYTVFGTHSSCSDTMFPGENPSVAILSCSKLNSLNISGYCPSSPSSSS